MYYEVVRLVTDGGVKQHLSGQVTRGVEIKHDCSFSVALKAQDKVCSDRIHSQSTRRKVQGQVYSHELESHCNNSTTIRHCR